MIRIDVHTTMTGPMLDGRAPGMVDRSAQEMQEHLASVGADFVRGELERVLRKETPYYRLQITTKNAPGASIIHDGGVIYGPWLEGTGSRNRTTRFKGYATFRRITQKLNAQATGILGPYVDRLVRRLDGGA